MIKVGVVGARGRMGQQVCATVAGQADLELVAQVDEGDSLEALLGSDVVVALRILAWSWGTCGGA